MNNENQSAIVFFSKDGNTKIGAKRLNERLNGKIIELTEARKGNVLQAFLKMGSKLQGSPWDGIKDATDIYLMQPIWASNAVPAMNAFLKKANFQGKTVTIITFQVSPDLNGSDKVHQAIGERVKNKQGIVKATYALIGGGIGECAGEEKINPQIDGIVI
ncbi:hypothetical protein [Acetobacterium bakii]|uniref:Flavodoxin-like domain-containing protein n=1 Tax=Acetobacterium bakii TaxID=52689 RepID=A0A0L6TZ98_9FIRM|nr:hypothetical protein [Acetobacterium bakii]KNZ41578.1 hypothetical protein AKG39_11370 [Acetobacterium bakii]